MKNDMSYSRSPRSNRESDPLGFDRRREEQLNRTLEEQHRQLQRDLNRMPLRYREDEIARAPQSLRNAVQARPSGHNGMDDNSNGRDPEDNHDNQGRQHQTSPTEPPPYENEDGEAEDPPPYTVSSEDHLIERGPHLVQVGSCLLERGNEVFPPPDYSLNNGEEGGHRPPQLRPREYNVILDSLRQLLEIERRGMHPAAASSMFNSSPSGLDRPPHAREYITNSRNDHRGGPVGRPRVWDAVEWDDDTDIVRDGDGRAFAFPRLSLDDAVGCESSRVVLNRAFPFQVRVRSGIGEARRAGEQDEPSYAERAGLFDYPGRRRRRREDNREDARDQAHTDEARTSWRREAEGSDDEDRRFHAERAELFRTRRRNPENAERNGRREREQRDRVGN